MRRLLIEKSQYKSGIPGFGCQLDMWTDAHNNISYVAIHVTIVVESAVGIRLVDHLLDFCVFPYTSHGWQSIHDWLVSTLCMFGLTADMFCSATPDGAAPGLKGLRAVEGLRDKVVVCYQHQLQRSILYSVGRAGSKTNCLNTHARDLIQLNKWSVQFSHQCNEFSKSSREMQAAADTTILWLSALNGIYAIRLAYICHS